MKIFEKLSLWFKIARGYTAPTSMIPYILAVALASKHYHIDSLLSLLGFLGVVMVHLSCNMLDDYFDWKKGAVAEYRKLSEQGIVNITHKCFYLEENLVTENQVLFVALLMDFIAFLFGLIIAFKVGYAVIFIAIITALMGFFYSAPPFRLSYRGLGEPVIGLIFGPLLMFGAYITAGATLDKTILLASVIAGILIANVAFAHAIMDFDADIKANKVSFPILFKTKNNAIWGLAISYTVACLFLILGVWLKIFPVFSLLPLIIYPKMIGLVKLLKSDSKEKKFWMGPIENWEQLQKEGSDWFMMRLCLSRNIMTEFIIIFVLTYYLFGG